MDKSVDNFLPLNVVNTTDKCHNGFMRGNGGDMKNAIRKAIRRVTGKAPKPLPEHWWKAWEEYQTYEQ